MIDYDTFLEQVLVPRLTCYCINVVKLDTFRDMNQATLMLSHSDATDALNKSMAGIYGLTDTVQVLCLSA